jgi:transposase
MAQEVAVLGRVDPQGSLLETRVMRRHLVTKGSFYERLAEHGDEIVSDDDFAHLYAPTMGRPSFPPSVVVRALLCATHDQTSDDKTSRRTRVDADWKAAMGVDDDFMGIAAPTLRLFRSRLVVHEAEATIFDATIAKAVKAKIFKGPLVAIIDSSPVRGAGAVADTYELIRGFVVKLARLATLPEPLGEAVAPLREGKADIDWQDPAARKAHLGELVVVARSVMTALGSSTDPAVVETLGHLAAVIDNDTEPDGDGGSKIRQGVARDRIVSHSDPEMRHGRKSASRRFNGHKLHVVTDEASELILGVDVGAGNGGDGEAAAPLLEVVQATEGVEVATLLADMAYSDGDTRVAVEAAGAELVAKVAPVNNGGLFPKTAFVIDLEAGTVTCPAGITTTDARPAKDHKGRVTLRYVFGAGVCGACALKASCTKAAGGREITISVHEARIAEARSAGQDPAVKALLRRRAKVERKIAHLQHLGMSKARYRGRTKTRLQALLAAAVANFNRLEVLGAFEADRDTAKAA